MSPFARSDTSLLSTWWWTVDRVMLVCVILLTGVGMILTLAASTPVAERLGLHSFHFALRQGVFLSITLAAMLGISLMSPRGVRRLALLVLPLSLFLMVLTLLIGPEIKGATRWLPLGTFTIQPSEFMKPAFAVVIAWLLAGQMNSSDFPGRKIALGLFGLAVALLMMQPDFGQTVLISAVWTAQMALAGLPLAWLVGIGATGLVGVGVAYVSIDNVASRIDRFLDPSSGDTYQVDTALNALRQGGLFGAGPGEGAVKRVLPDAHTDYIFAVAGEEFGAFACLAILAIFAAIVVRGLAWLLEEEDPFIMLASAGLLIQFGLQAVINVGVNLALVPSKGMTLPFISYGGSSMLALGFGMGMVLALTRRNRFLTGYNETLGRVPS